MDIWCRNNNHGRRHGLVYKYTRRPVPSMQIFLCLSLHVRLMARGDLCGLLLEVGDEVVAVLILLEATEGHLGARDVLFGVLKVCE